MHGVGRTILACGLMIASGFAALAYQIVWTQQSTLWLGHEAAAVLAVVGAFFGGLAFGALLLSSRLERSPSPVRWYAACELTIGLWSIALAFLLEPVSGALLHAIGPQPSAVWHWFVAFCGTFVLLLPATAAMGATLPAMERAISAHRSQATISVLYAANTLGAVIGVLAAAFWLVPAYGLLRTAIVCAVLNIACALATLRLPSIAEERSMPADSARTRVLWLLAATGALGIGYEVLMVRALSQIAENTVYTFAILLAIYLIGTTLGAALYARLLVRTHSHRTQDRLLRMLGVACLSGALSLAIAKHVKGSVSALFGTSMGTSLAAEVVLALAAFLLPTIAMGALFSHLSTKARTGGVSFARAFGCNTLGAACAPIVFGVVLLPSLGSSIALPLIALGYFALVDRAVWTRPAQRALVATTLAIIVWGPALETIDVPAGGRIVSHVEGVTATVSIVEDASGVATLHINNRQQEGSSASVLADARQALIPIVLHPAPRRALFLGVGTAITASAATAEPLLRVDAVELVPEVIAASSYFTRELNELGSTTRLKLVNADARRFIRTTRKRYDLIVSDNFHPARSGSGSLYTVEHFALIRERLAQGGVFCQWLPLHQLDLDTLRSIVRSYLSVYPHATALLATNSLETPVVGLLARRDGELFDLEQIRMRLHDDGSAARYTPFDLSDELAVLGTFVAGPHALTRFAGNAPINSDDHPVVSYRAPRMTYSPASLPRERLIALLDELEITPREALVIPEWDRSFDARLAAYWSARNQFILAGRNVRPTSDVQSMLAQVRAPLLSVLRISPDFRPAYDPLLQMAIALGRIDTAAARALLHELDEVQPLRAEALDALHTLPSVDHSARASLLEPE